MRFFLLSFVFLLAACQAEAPAEAPEAPAEATPDVAVVPPSSPLNLNTATAEEFKTIPGVGDRMVHEFEEYRPYSSIEQFRREIGKYVDEDQVTAYEPYVFVPVNPDSSDMATMMQLPGVGEAEAAMLVDGRPYATQEAFMARYAEAVSGGDAEAAAAYLAR